MVCFVVEKDYSVNNLIDRSFIAKVRVLDVLVAILALICLLGGGYYLVTDAPWPRGGGSLNSAVGDGGRVKGGFVLFIGLWTLFMLFKKIKKRAGG